MTEQAVKDLEETKKICRQLEKDINTLKIITVAQFIALFSIYIAYIVSNSSILEATFHLFRG